MERQSSLHELTTLIHSAHPLIVVETTEEERFEGLAKAAARNTRLPFFTWTASQGLTDPESPAAYRPPEADAPIEALKAMGSKTERAIFLLKDFTPHLDGPVKVRACREMLQLLARRGSTAIVVGPEVALPKELAHVSVPFAFQLPTRDDMRRVVEDAVAYAKKNNFPVEMQATDWDRLVDALTGMTLNQARQALNYALLEDRKITARDIDVVLDRKSKLIRDGGLLEYYAPGQNHFALGGFAGLKTWLARAKMGYTPEAKALNLKPPRGVLLVGVQGCGKSLAAKVIARELGFPLLKLDASRLYDKYVGETEANFRRATAMASSIAPVVLWIDEIEKGFSPDGGSGGDSALGKRVFGSFLTWLQEKDPRIFVAATANDLNALPPELQRKGRFDEVFFVDLPTPAERVEIFQLHLRLRNLEPATFDGNVLVAATDGFSGAEIEQAVVTALYQALHQKRALDTATLLHCLKGTVPLSVSRKEDLDALREIARGRFVPAA